MGKKEICLIDKTDSEFAKWHDSRDLSVPLVIATYHDEDGIEGTEGTITYTGDAVVIESCGKEIERWSDREDKPVSSDFLFGLLAPLLTKVYGKLSKVDEVSRVSFITLVDEFKSEGYEVCVDGIGGEMDHPEKVVAWVNSENIRACFSICNPKVYPDAYGKICVDRDDCFNKWSQCPIVLPIPKNEKQMKYLFDKIAWLLTDEGCESSDTFDYETWTQDYPLELKNMKEVW